MHTGFWWGNLGEGDLLKDPDVDGDNIKMDLQEVGRWHALHRCGSGYGQGHACCADQYFGRM